MLVSICRGCAKKRINLYLLLSRCLCAGKELHCFERKHVHYICVCRFVYLSLFQQTLFLYVSVHQNENGRTKKIITNPEKIYNTKSCLQTIIIIKIKIINMLILLLSVTWIIISSYIKHKLAFLHACILLFPGLFIEGFTPDFFMESNWSWHCHKA